jgi:flagellar hook-associated protein 1 FlgK
MLGLFGALNMASGAMDAQQEGIEVAGQNMANVDNSAYAREQLVLESSIPMPTSIGSEGTGVEATAITEVRDALLDQQITSETSVTGSLTSQQTALQYVQDALGEELQSSSSSSSDSTSVGTTGGLADDLSGLFNAFQTLSTNPSSLADRQAVIAAGQQLSSQFNQVDQQLTSLNSQLNQSVQTGVTSANQYLSDIASLNQQIIAAQAGNGGTANTLIDQRQQDLESLANLVNVQTTANSDGSINLSVDGNSLIAGSNLEDTLQTYDAGGGQLLVATAGASGTPLTLTSGSIQGTIQARDGALATLQTGVNTLASQLVTQVNTVYSAGYDLNGNTGADFFTGTNASDIAVSSALAGNPETLQASGTAGATGDNTVALALAQLADTEQSGLGNQTFSGSYNYIITNLGSSLSSVNNELTDQQTVQSMLTQQRNSEDGVNMDEEMTNVVSYERAYQGAAELVTTLDQMLNMVVGMKQNP